MKEEFRETLVIGAGAAGLNCALHLPAPSDVLVLCKGGLKESDSFLAQGGICVLHDPDDAAGYFEDTMRAGHYENNPDTVRCMIEHSRETIDELITFGVRFAREENGELAYTREGAHSRPRIVFHADCTGKEITSHLLAAAQKRTNIELRPYTTMLDLLFDDGGTCLGAAVRDNRSGEVSLIYAGNTVLATGGVGGLFAHSTNYRILTGDGVGAALAHGVAADHLDYVQFHPTTLYTKRRGRRFLISESVRGEGAQLLNAAGERFVDELLPRDVVTAAIRKEMAKEGSDHVRLDLRTVRGGEHTLEKHFPGILHRCRKGGLRRPARARSRRSRTALFHGRRSQRSVGQDDGAPSLCRRGDVLQRRPRQKPSCLQFSSGSAHLRPPRGTGHHGRRPCKGKDGLGLHTKGDCRHAARTAQAGHTGDAP